MRTCDNCGVPLAPKLGHGFVTPENLVVCGNAKDCKERAEHKVTRRMPG